MAARRAASAKTPTGRRKRHVVRAGAERQLEHAEARHVARLDCSAAELGNVRISWPPVPTTNWRMPRSQVEPAARSFLRREALVVVVVPDEDDVGARVESACQNGLHVTSSLPCEPEEKRGWCQ